MNHTIVEIELEYGWEPSAPALKLFKKTVGESNVVMDKDNPKRIDWAHRKFQMALQDAVSIAPGQFVVNCIIDSPLTNRLDEIIEHLKRLDPKPPFNEKVHVAVPGNGLLEIREVQLLQDCCTDTLQTEIKSGWRILAICPQPDQRRPDYIIGK